jgi:hypothetical protein
MAGMSCRDALVRLFHDPSVRLTLDEVCDALAKAHNKRWKPSTVDMHLRFYSINHPHRKGHPETEGHCFLFWDGAKRFRRWIPEEDGTWVLRNGRVERVDAVPEEQGSAEPSSPLVDLDDSTIVGPDRKTPLPVIREGAAKGRAARPFRRE